MNVYFSISEFYRDGDLEEKGVYLHFGDMRIKVAEDPKGYKNFVNELYINKSFVESFGVFGHD